MSDTREWCKRVPQVMAQVEDTDDSLEYQSLKKNNLISYWHGMNTVVSSSHKERSA